MSHANFDHFNKAVFQNALTSAITPVRYGDGPQLSAFSRLRVSDTHIILSSVQTHSQNPLMWCSSSVSGAAGVFDSNKSTVRLMVSATSGSQIISQTKRHFHYSAGHSQLMLCSFGSGSQQPNIRKRVGTFTELDGLFLEINGTTDIAFVVRSSTSGSSNISERRFLQDDWNIDKFDGSGSSGIHLDFSKTQIVSIDYQWLGVGRIRYGFDVNGIIYIAHEVYNANNLDSVYIAAPHLPVRYEITNLGGGSATEFHQICSMVAREGGQTEQHIQTSISNTTFNGTTINNTNERALISIRLNPLHITDFIRPILWSVLPQTAVAMKFRLLLNPSGTTTIPTGSWANVGQIAQWSESQYNVSGGHCLGTVLLDQGTGARSQVVNNIANYLGVASDITGSSDVLVIAGIAAGGASNACVGEITFFEEF